MLISARNLQLRFQIHVLLLLSTFKMYLAKTFEPGTNI